jgi:hypothetical protein
MIGMVLVAFMQAGSAAAATPPPATTTVAPVVARANPEDKVVCRAQVETGTRLGGHKVCMKKSDWEAQAADARRQRDFAPPAGIAGQH